MSSQQLGFGNARVFRRPLVAIASKAVSARPGQIEALIARESGSAEAVSIGRVMERMAERARQSFQALPAPTGSSPYHLSLDSVLAADDVTRIRDQNLLVFQTAGDTGGVNDSEPQRRVVQCMLTDFDRVETSRRPAFFFHLGDVVYFKGEAREYYPQFYEPYEDYPAPIFALAGNHDGSGWENGRSLDAFVRNFCATTPNLSADAMDITRDAMTQPNVYFTLETPLATIIGLYSNVPEGGVIQADQLAWFTEELATAPHDRALFVAVHHPLYSLDDHHSGSQAMVDAFRRAVDDSGRIPDVVLTAHVHNYQRFTWRVRGREIPLIVAGGGGYQNLHKIPKRHGHRLETPFREAGSDATLEHYVDRRHGFLRIEVTNTTVTGKYYQVPSDEDNDRGDRVDLFRLDLESHRLMPR
jgi:acid phosphatase type 7